MSKTTYQRNKPHVNIGTIGHVAHGKSTVVKSISGVQTVRFKNELERNITIKLGYANAKVYKLETPREGLTSGPPGWQYCSHGSSHAGMCCSWMSCFACPRLRDVLSNTWQVSPNSHDWLQMGCTAARACGVRLSSLWSSMNNPQQLRFDRAHAYACPRAHRDSALPERF